MLTLHKASRWLQMLVMAAALIYLATLCAPYARPPQRIDTCMGECVETYAFMVGRREIVLETFALVEGDNGSAEIIITQNGQLLDSLVGSFDYDLWSDEPIGHVDYRWIDDDTCLDLLITLEENGATTDQYVITCANPQLVPLP